MEDRKKRAKSLDKDLGFSYSAAPRTHIFYEFQGERAVDPLLMIGNGISLWHEQMVNIQECDLSPLWGYAERLLADRFETPMYSYVEWLRSRITMGAVVPEKWDQARPYPYKGMLISAIYFQEARRLCEEGEAGRAWHIITMAYYQLGLNTMPSQAQAASKAATVRQAEASMYKRALVLEALEWVKKKGVPKSIREAKDRVYDLIANSKRAMAILEEQDALTPEGIKHRKDNDALERLRNTLDSWASPKGPYPEMSEAFSQFAKGKARAAKNSFRQTSEAIPIDALPEECAHYMRLVNYMNDDYVLTFELSRDAEEDDTDESPE